MADVKGASLQPIYERLNGAPSYHPLEADTFADWSIEAGDVVTVTRDNKGYDSPVHSSVLQWRRQPQVTISSTGNESRDSIAKMSQKKYRNGSGGLRSSQYLHYYVEDQYKQMKSGLELTTSSAFLYVEDAYKQMSSGLKLTSSSASLYVENAYKQMKSGLDLTSSSAHLYVENAYKQMASGLKLSSSSAILYAQSRTSKAEIVARINEKGYSEALILADRITLDGGLTTLGSVLSVAYDQAWFKKPVRIGTRRLTTIDGGTIHAHSLGILYDPNSSATYDIDAATIAKMIKTASKSSNTLTLTRFDGSTLTFSKATQLSGTWSGSGKLKVTADDSSVPAYERLLIAKPESGGYVPIYAQWGASGQYEEDTGFRVPVSGGIPTALGIYDENSTLVPTTKTLSYGQNFSAWAGYKDANNNWVWGNEIHFTAPSDRTKISNNPFTCSITEEAGGTRYRYTLTASISSGVSVPLVDGQTYVLYKQ